MCHRQTRKVFTVSGESRRTAGQTKERRDQTHREQCLESHKAVWKDLHRKKSNSVSRITQIIITLCHRQTRKVFADSGQPCWTRQRCGQTKRIPCSTLTASKLYQKICIDLSNEDQKQRKLGRKQELLTEWDQCHVPGGWQSIDDRFHTPQGLLGWSLYIQRQSSPSIDVHGT